jgi:hypothetical protein
MGKMEDMAGRSLDARFFSMKYLNFWTSPVPAEANHLLSTVPLLAKALKPPLL